LHFKRGEYVAIMGSNGSGKSTLLKAICGLIQLDLGQIRVLNKVVRSGGFGRDFFGQVGVVFQEPESQFLMRDVKTEIISVLQNLGASLIAQQNKFDSLVERFNLANILDQKPENLSGGQMQLVNLACALAAEPKILLLDEPTSFLDSFNKATLLGLLDVLTRAGVTIIHITQYPDEAARAGRIIILDNGKLAHDCPPVEMWDNTDLLTTYKLQPPPNSQFRKLFGFGIDDVPKAKELCKNFKLPDAIPITQETSSLKSSDNSVLSILNLDFHYPKSGFSLKIPNLGFSKGKVVGLIGATGSVNSTLAFLIAGLISPDSGLIECFGKPVAGYSIKELRSKIGITWQLPDLIMLGPTVKDDIEFTLNNLDIENVNIGLLLNRVGLDGFGNRIVDTLSGGEKRKLSLADVLATDPDFIIFDEPTAFLDPNSQQELSVIISNLAKEGRGIIIAGHDLNFISNLSDRIIGIRAGRIVSDLPAPIFFSNNSNLAALDLPPHPIVAFRQTLSEQGCPLPYGSLSLDKIRQFFPK
jgi:energy-coupling factor transport system ATP-binding protein